MLINNRKALTLIEILVCLAILSGIIGVILTTMSRGASNVQKGSFNALAANQAFWIVSVIRNDVGKAIEKIDFGNPEGVWKGENPLEVTIEGGKASYTIEKKGNNIKFLRKFTPTNTNRDFKISDEKLQKFGDEYMTDLTLTEKKDNGVTSYYLEITMEDSKPSTPGKKDMVWTASIYPPVTNNIDQYWVPTVEVSN